MVVRLRDLSVEGLGIVAPRQIAVETQFTVALPRRGQRDLVLDCEVRHCKKVTDRVHHVGARFISDNAADERFGVGKKAKRIRQAILS